MSAGFELGRDEVIYAIAEDTFGVPKVPAATDAIRHKTYSSSQGQPRENRNDKRGTREFLETITKRKDPGEWSIESWLMPSGVGGTAPDLTVFLKSLFGSESIFSTGSIVTTSVASASTFDVTGGHGLAIGMWVMISVKAAAWSVARNQMRLVTNVATNTITVAPDFDATPSVGVAVNKTVGYVMTADPNIPITIYSQQTTMEKVDTGCAVGQAEFSFPGDGEVMVTFSGQSAEQGTMTDDQLNMPGLGSGESGDSGMLTAAALKGTDATPTATTGTFIVRVDGGDWQTMSFSSPANPSAIVTDINNGTTGITATNAGTDNILIVSDTTQTASNKSSVEIGAGTENANLGFTEGDKHDCEEVIIDEGRNIQPQSVFILGTEQCLVESVSSNTLTVTRGFNSTSVAAHADDLAITPFVDSLTPTTAGSPVESTEGDFIWNSSTTLKMTNFTFTMNHNLRMHNNEFGTSKPSGFDLANFDGTCSFDLKIRAADLKHMTDAKNKVQGAAFIQAGRTAGRIPAAYLPIVEMDVPEINAPEEEEITVSLSGRFLASGGNDSAYLGVG